MAQYFQFQHAEKQAGPPLHVCHCHSPSSDNQKETPTQEQIIRKLTDERRAKIFEALWNQVEKNNPREHPCSVAEPAAIFGGDFNSTDLEWAHVLEKAWKTQASRRSIQRCVSSYSTPAHKLHKGDRAIVFNGNALQQDSHRGKKLVPAEVPKSRVTSQTTTTSCAFPFTGRFSKQWNIKSGKWKSNAPQRPLASMNLVAQPAPSPVPPSHAKPKRAVPTGQSQQQEQSASSATQPSPQVPAEEHSSAAQPASTPCIPKPKPVSRTIPPPPPLMRTPVPINVSTAQLECTINVSAASPVPASHPKRRPIIQSGSESTGKNATAIAKSSPEVPAERASGAALPASPPDHPKPERVHIPSLIELEAGHVEAACGMVYEAHLTRGFQLEQDMEDAKQSFNAAQASRAASGDPASDEQ